MNDNVMVDLSNVYPPADAEKAGFAYCMTGR